jgi:hypothetical protein
MAVLGVVRPQGVEELGMAGPGEFLGSLWIPLAIWAWREQTRNLSFTKNSKKTWSCHSKGPVLNQVYGRKRKQKMLDLQ